VRGIVNAVSAPFFVLILRLMHSIANFHLQEAVIVGCLKNRYFFTLSCSLALTLYFWASLANTSIAFNWLYKNYKLN